MKSHASIFITAQSGMGKSYLATYLIEHIDTARKYIIDYTGEYEIPGFSIFTVSPENYTALDQVMDKYDRLIFRFSFVSNKNIEAIVDYISHRAIYQKNTMIVYEECHEYIDKRKPAQFIRMVATGGRKFGVSSLYISQRPSLLNSTIRSQTNIRISGKMTDPTDYDAIRNLFSHYYLIPKLKPRVFLFHGIDGKEFIFTTENVIAQHRG